MERELTLEEVSSLLSGETLAVYLLWEDGMSSAHIAEKLGILVSDVQDDLFVARMRIQRYKAYLQARESDERNVEFSLTLSGTEGNFPGAAAAGKETSARRDAQRRA